MALPSQSKTIVSNSVHDGLAAFARKIGQKIPRFIQGKNRSDDEAGRVIIVLSVLTDRLFTSNRSHERKSDFFVRLISLR